MCSVEEELWTQVNVNKCRGQRPLQAHSLPLKLKWPAQEEPLILQWRACFNTLFNSIYKVSVNVPARQPRSAAATGLFLALSGWQQTHKTTDHSRTHPTPPFASLLNVLICVAYWIFYFFYCQLKLMSCRPINGLFLQLKEQRAPSLLTPAVLTEYQLPCWYGIFFSPDFSLKPRLIVAASWENKTATTP